MEGRGLVGGCQGVESPPAACATLYACAALPYLPLPPYPHALLYLPLPSYPFLPTPMPHVGHMGHPLCI